MNNETYKELLQKLIDVADIKEQIDAQTEYIIGKYLDLRSMSYISINDWYVDEYGNITVEYEIGGCSCCDNTEYESIDIKFFTDFDTAARELEAKIEAAYLKQVQDRKEQKEDAAYIKQLQELELLKELKAKYES